MLIAVAVVFLILRPAVMKRLWVFLLPALIVVHLALPGAIGGLRQSFFPSEGIVADQTEHGGRISSKRLDPQFDIIKAQPAFGQGYGTRVTAGDNQNARILDNQWLGTAVETGLVGIFAWAWLFVRFIRRAGSTAKRDLSARGWLLTALASSVVAFAVGMFTFDAFSFIQVAFVLFVLLALGASTLACNERWPEAAGSSRSPRDGSRHDA
jgi:O-antigen ligase